ncbi:MAG: glycosyltransferase family 2 protein [Bacteroidota bacterium]
MQPLVSIITPMFNNENSIEHTITSVVEQTYPNWELLLVDDASSDGTLNKIKPYQNKDPRIKLFTHATNLGAGKARNYGTEMASGAFIAFLDADDIWAPNKLEVQLHALESSQKDVCFSSYELIDANGSPLFIKVNALPELTYNKLLRANYIGNLTGMYNAYKLGKIYTSNLRKRQDWLLWLDAIKRSHSSAIGIEDTLAYYRVAKGSLSSGKLGLIKHNYQVYRKGLRFSTIKSSMYLLIFLFEHLFIKRRLITPIDER